MNRSFFCSCGIHDRRPLPTAAIQWPLTCACGRVWLDPDTLSQEDSRVVQPAAPNPLEKVKNYTKAYAKWVSEGYPRRTSEERTQLLEICQSCHLHDGNICTHPKCGCSVDTKKRIWGDKLSWRTESCPDGKWPPELITEAYRPPEITGQPKVAVLTAPRKQETVRQCVKSIQQAGYTDIQLYNDVNKERGPLGNFVMAARDGCQLIFQDDAILSKGAKEFLEKNHPKGFDVLALYTAAPNDQSKFNPGWREAPKSPNQCYGGLGYYLSRHTLSLLRSRPIEVGSGRAADVRFAKWIKEHELKFYLHSPSLIKHIGVTSTLGDHGISPARQCKSWIIDCNTMELEQFPERPKRN